MQLEEHPLVFRDLAHHCYYCIVMQGECLEYRNFLEEQVGWGLIDGGNTTFEGEEEVGCWREEGVVWKGANYVHSRVGVQPE